jgi:hypothetical protein
MTRDGELGDLIVGLDGTMNSQPHIYLPLGFESSGRLRPAFSVHRIDDPLVPNIGCDLVEQATDGPRKGLNPPPALS